MPSDDLWSAFTESLLVDLAGDDERAIFDTTVSRLRDQHPRKRTLMAKIDARGW